jgi:hypothetical protein
MRGQKAEEFIAGLLGAGVRHAQVGEPGQQVVVRFQARRRDLGVAQPGNQKPWRENATEEDRRGEHAMETKSRMTLPIFVGPLVPGIFGGQHGAETVVGGLRGRGS